jgi:hypothetical protein
MTRPNAAGSLPAKRHGEIAEVIATEMRGVKVG